MIGWMAFHPEKVVAHPPETRIPGGWALADDGLDEWFRGRNRVSACSALLMRHTAPQRGQAAAPCISILSDGLGNPRKEVASSFASRRRFLPWLTVGLL